MAKDVSKVIPVAERIIEFTSEDILTNPEITHYAENLISESAWNEFAKSALVIMDGWNIAQYAEEYPIVHYRCDDVVREYIKGCSRLNSFIESITVSTALYGKIASFGSGKLTCEKAGYNTVAYYTDNEGINHAIRMHDIYSLLIQKPKLVITNEGVLLFFTDKKILATVDCEHYYWIDGHVIDVENKIIKDIQVDDDKCEIILEDNEEFEHRFNLKFEFDITEHQMICPEAIEI